MREQTRSLQQPTAGRPWLEYLSSAGLALLLSIVVWVMAVYEQDPPKTDFFEGIPIKYVNTAPGLVLVGNAEERIRVEIRAPSSHWPGLTPDAIEATADLQGLGVGVHNVGVAVRTPDKMAQMVKLAPARVVVRLEESVRREVDVRTVIADADSVPPGYAAAPPQISPNKVTLSGPRSLIESVTEVAATVWLRSSKVAVENAVAPVALNAKGEEVSGVDLTPRTVTITVGVTPLAEFRDVTVRAALKGVPAAGYWVSNITIEPATVTVQGKPDNIRTLPAVVSTLPIDITGVRESVSKRVSLVLPQGMSIYSADASGQNVLVHVEVTAIVGGKTVQPKVEMQGLRSGLTATIAPDTVDVILSGPMPDLQALQPGDLSVVVNLFGLKPGRYMITPTVRLPDQTRLKVESISPEVVEVTIAAPAGGSQ